MVYRITEAEIFEQWEEFRSDYPDFSAYRYTEIEKKKIAESVVNVLRTQNGQDFDDYSITDSNDKVGKYLTDVPKKSRVLIHGVGTGREVLVAKDMGFDTHGTTLGSRNVAFAKRMLSLTDYDITECLVDALPYSSEWYDVVIGVQIFEHVVSPLPFLLEQSRVLKVGGKLILEWPPASTHTMDDNPHHQVCFVPGQAHGLFRKAGFSDIKVCYNTLEEVPPELWWSGEAIQGEDSKDKMLCIQGTKSFCDKDYVQRAHAQNG